MHMNTTATRPILYNCQIVTATSICLWYGFARDAAEAIDKTVARWNATTGTVQVREAGQRRKSPLCEARL
jgi:hypothetical protein